MYTFPTYVDPQFKIQIYINTVRNHYYIGFLYFDVITVGKLIDIPPKCTYIVILERTMNGTYDFASGEIIPHQQIKIR